MRDPESVRTATVILIGEVLRLGTDKAAFCELTILLKAAVPCFQEDSYTSSSNDFADTRFCYISERLTFRLHRNRLFVFV